LRQPSIVLLAISVGAKSKLFRLFYLTVLVTHQSLCNGHFALFYHVLVYDPKGKAAIARGVGLLACWYIVIFERLGLLRATSLGKGTGSGSAGQAFDLFVLTNLLGANSKVSH
jgi:hypothetical protein